MAAVPSWVESYRRLCARCGGGLVLMGLGGVEIAVYVYLFHRLVGKGEAAASASGIFGALDPIRHYLPEHYRPNFTRNAVGEAAKKLAALGLVEVSEAKRAAGSAGRPPARTYKAVTLGEAKRAVEEALDGYKRGILQSLDPFEQIEEGRNVSEDTLPEAERA